MNVKKTKSSKKIILKITMSMTDYAINTHKHQQALLEKFEKLYKTVDCQGHSTHDAPSELKTRKSS